MPTWGEILHEVQTAQAVAPGTSPFDVVRRKYLAALAAHTGNDVIVYASGWTQGATGPNASINVEDVQAFMEVVHGLKGTSLDLILHSGGGSPEATEAIVSYLRQKFTTIRAIIPQAAMSAATMLACATNALVMGRHSSIGPIDPQLVMRMDGQLIQAPAAAIVEQFREAQGEIQKDPSKLASWIPILRLYGPALLAQCRFAEQLSKTLVTEWLTKYMLAGQVDADKRAGEIATRLAKHDDHMTHGRFIPRDRARQWGLTIVDLESDQTLQDLALSVFHAITLTFTSTAAIKIVENQNGKAFVKQEQRIVMQQMIAPTPPQPAKPAAGAPSGGPLPLIARRAPALGKSKNKSKRKKKRRR